ncbi:MFS transporter, DHA1 family, bicyclomycin/chloramphenicol resistance protein [Pseudomonas sp. 8AS]|uniref:multidrug effflux MFS transporter n=1 Tax=Pseudomonas sp. 8AS TaxID=2653163 RepID=UPI0012F1C523|nr:multidrug effflux MFS transporter [Pseudomonas sp. 8AS]VXC11868.1 MFS transporter, DHA1 family, bicyclomycin/chloramphenicol resistance protein [Pseudomonas sp. 8AS]
MAESTRFVALVACLVSLGQFAIATYLPAFAAIAADLGATAVQVQQSLTAYLLPFALALLGHGAIADAFGRRRYVLLGLALFVLGSLLCALAQNIHGLYLGRAIQGLAAGIGLVVGRAMLRDRFDGVQAQRQLALVAILFCLAPALAPLCGGWLLPLAGWRGVFVFLALLGAALLFGSWRHLAETLPQERRQSLRPRALIGGYAELLRDGRFLLICLANAGVNVAIYLYVLSAPVFVVRHLGLGEQSFAWLFLPLVAGLLIGALAAHRLVGRLATNSGVLLGHGVMLIAGLLNIALALWLPVALPWAVLALPLFGVGLMLTQPGLQVLAMDCFPQRRGLASSAFVTLQQFGNALSAALLVPLLLGSTLHLALGMAGLQLLGLLAFTLALAGRARQRLASSA